MSHESYLGVALLLVLASVFTLTNMMRRQGIQLRSLDKKLDVLLKAQGIERPALSYEVQVLAQDPRTKIAAIKLHREENPALSIAEAKAEVEAFAVKKD